MKNKLKIQIDYNVENCPGRQLQKETLRLCVLMMDLLSDYLFPSCPLPFEKYSISAGYLSEPLFKLLLFDYSRLTYSV